ncbi:MAG: xanthine dehydrogenase accessory protein XdhC [Caldimonas sp.]
MSSLRTIGATWLALGRATVVVRVAEARGSVPRGTGTRMLVSQDHDAGTIGGGHLELKAIEEARTLLRAGEAMPCVKHYPLGPALGQCCGGAVTLAFAPLDAAALATWPTSEPRFHLQLYGAGHVGRAIARALEPLAVVVDWIDERDDEFPAAFHEESLAPWPDHIHKVSVDAVEREVARAPSGAFFLVLTHRHDLDEKITEAILRRGDFAFLGLIGSKTKRQRFVHRFEARGIGAETITRMTCPIGLPGIVGKEPEVIAASVVAQLLMASEPAVRSATASSPSLATRAV